MQPENVSFDCKFFEVKRTKIVQTVLFVFSGKPISTKYRYKSTDS